MESHNCAREYTNVKDRYAVAVKNAGRRTVGPTSVPYSLDMGGVYHARLLVQGNIHKI